jgi:outer membrane protein assembly factor BamD
MRWAFASVVSLSCLVAALGCGGAAGRFASGSFERGSVEFEEENYLDAIDDLKLFIRRNPTDERAPEAQMMIAKAYMQREDYPVAAVELEILRKDYPNSALFDDAFYLQGVCYVEQVPRIELQQQVTRDAVDHFTRYLRDLPQGTHRDEATRQLATLNLHLDEKTLAAARHYVKVRRWAAARVYLRSFVAERTESQLMPDALYLLAETERKTDEAVSARGHLEELVRRFPEHPLAISARSELDEDDAQNDES